MPKYKETRHSNNNTITIKVRKANSLSVVIGNNTHSSNNSITNLY